MTSNGFVGLTPTEAHADLVASAARTRLTVTTTRPPSTAAARLRDAHRQHVEANTRVALAERELDLATTAATDAELILAQAKDDLIMDTLGVNYGPHH